jgi:BirA family biotin operon repressor/biotin-[acetyl-CoA-carboxylase] ligase
VRVSLVTTSGVDSTQRFARTLLDRHFREDEVPGAFVVLAREQDAGRGRRGRSWASAPGLGVWASLVAPIRSEALPLLPIQVSVALAEVVGRELGGECRIKWPNDLVVGRRKLGGLLLDAVARRAGEVWVIVGMGLNHGHSPEQLPHPGATSLRAAAGSRPIPDLDAFALLCLEAVWNAITVPRGDWISRYRELSAHERGDAVACELGEGRVEGAFVGFDESGFLVLDTDVGRRTIRSGEVFEW